MVFGKTIYSTVISLLGENKIPYASNYTDKCANVRKYKILTKESVSDAELEIIETSLKDLGIPVVEVENYHTCDYRGRTYNKLIIHTPL